MTRDEAKGLLEAGEFLRGGAWHWGWYGTSGSIGCCEDNCCSGEFETIDEVLDCISEYVGWDGVST